MILSKIKSYAIVATAVLIVVMAFAIYHYMGVVEKKTKEIQKLETTVETLNLKSTEYDNEIKKITEDLIRAREALQTIEAQKKLSDNQRKQLVERLKKYEFDLQVERDRITAAKTLNEEYRNIISCIEKATGKEGATCK